jgi:arginyl-tRNA--protein-N-Asp/Glu arginylyltransferase
MNLKLHEIVALHYELNGIQKQSKGLLAQKMPMKLKIFLHRISKMTAEENKTYEEQRLELYKKYGEEKDQNIVLKPENVLEFNKELTEMLEAEKEIDVKPFWGEANIVELIEQVETDEYYPIFYKLIGI